MNAGRNPIPAAASFAAYTIFATIVLLELLLRFADPIGIAYYFETDRYFADMVKHDAYAYIHAPNDTSRYQGVDVITNEEGLRSPPVTQPKPPGRRRILLLGDSLVFGWGAPQDSLFAAHAGREFRTRGEDVDLVAAGAGSWNTRTQCEYLRARGLDLEPDAIALVILPNDVVPKRSGASSVPRDSLLAKKRREGPAFPRWWRSLVRVSYAAATVQHLALQPDSRETILSQYDEAAPAWRDARAAVAEIAALASGAGARLTAFLYMTDDASDYQELFRARYESALRENDVPCTILRRPDGREYQNSFVDRHPNARGHRAIFDQIFPHLQETVSAPASAQAPSPEVR